MLGLRLSSSNNMKIFNWVHRRFNNNNHKEDGELAKDDANQSDRKIIGIDHNQFVAVSDNSSFSGWKGGIFLTIGTFGYDPLESHYYDGDDDHDDEEEHVNDHHVEGIVSSDEIEQIIVGSDRDEEVKPLMKHAAAAYAHEDLLKMEEEAAVDGKNKEEVVEVDNVPSKKERKTLAELFFAEQSEEGSKGKSAAMIDAEKTSKTKENPRDDKSRIPSAAGKKSPGKDAASARPMGKRLHRLVKKMLKKKIHPELGLNSNKNVDPAPKSALAGSGEFDSLLPIQDAVM